jgi:hypothetical protein
MKKTLSIVLSMIAVLLLSTAVFADTGLQKDFSLKQWNALNNDGLNNVFSLTENYNTALKIESIYNFEKTHPFMVQAASGDVESIKAEIARLKKKKSTSLIGAGVLTALAAFFVYEAIIYEDPERTNQVDESRGTSNRGIGRIGWVAGAGFCVVISAMLVGGASKAGKAIKAYEKELKDAAAVQK